MAGSFQTPFSFRGVASFPDWMNERVHPALLLFLVICLNRLHLPLSGGEEQYLAYALQHYNPDWIPDSFSYSEFPGTRLLFQTITGFFVHKVGFMATAIFGRLAVFILISFPLARLFRYLNLNNLWMLVVIQVFLLTSQSFFADEWIFRTLEPKVPAYIFLFWGLLFFLSDRFLLMAVALAIATWFHILVGGWFMVAVTLVIMMNRVPIRKWIVGYGVFALMVLPLFVYLWPVFLEQASANHNLNHVYVYFRLKHHLGLFDSYSYFVSKHLGGVVVALVVLLVQPFLYRRFSDKTTRNLVLLNGVFLSLALLFVVLAWIDMQFLNKAGSLGLTYYPFRMMSLSLLITLMLVVLYLRTRFHGFEKTLKWLAGFALLVVMARTAINIQMLQEALKPDTKMALRMEAVKSVSAPGDVFVLIEPDYATATSFGRLTRREPYVVFKFVPAGTWKLAEWYRRIGIVEQMQQDPSSIPVLAKQEGIRFVLARAPLADPSLELCWHASSYYLYRVISLPIGPGDPSSKILLNQIHNE